MNLKEVVVWKEGERESHVHQKLDPQVKQGCEYPISEMWVVIRVMWVVISNGVKWMVVRAGGGIVVMVLVVKMATFRLFR